MPDKQIRRQVHGIGNRATAGALLTMETSGNPDSG
jgi:hypothetical protein